MDPELYPEDADEWDNEVIDEEKDVNIEVSQRGYGKPSKISEIYPITIEDSEKFSS